MTQDWLIWWGEHFWIKWFWKKIRSLPTLLWIIYPFFLPKNKSMWVERVAQQEKPQIHRALCHQRLRHHDVWKRSQNHRAWLAERPGYRRWRWFLSSQVFFFDLLGMCKLMHFSCLYICHVYIYIHAHIQIWCTAILDFLLPSQVVTCLFYIFFWVGQLVSHDFRWKHWSGMGDCKRTCSPNDPPGE